MYCTCVCVFICLFCSHNSKTLTINTNRSHNKAITSQKKTFFHNFFLHVFLCVCIKTLWVSLKMHIRQTECQYEEVHDDRMKQLLLDKVYLHSDPSRNCSATECWQICGSCLLTAAGEGIQQWQNVGWWSVKLSKGSVAANFSLLKHNK